MDNILQIQEPVVVENVRKACENTNYRFKLIDLDSYSVYEISDTLSNKKVIITGNANPKYPINSYVAFDLAKDKVWTDMILKQEGFNVIPGQSFFVKQISNSSKQYQSQLEDAYEYAEGKYPLLVKPNRGSFGQNVVIVNDKESLESQLLKIAETDFIAILQEIQSYPEYRIVVLDGKVEYLYSKKPQSIYGDGRKTIFELIEESNQAAKTDLQIINIDYFIRREMQKRNLNLNSVLLLGESLSVRANVNITMGATIVDYSENVTEKLEKWAAKIAKSLNLCICGIDIFVKNGLDNPDDFIVIEVNGNPNLKGITQIGHQDKAIEIWKKVLDIYFSRNIYL